MYDHKNDECLHILYNKFIKIYPFVDAGPPTYEKFLNGIYRSKTYFKHELDTRHLLGYAVKHIGIEDEFRLYIDVVHVSNCFSLSRRISNNVMLYNIIKIKPIGKNNWELDYKYFITGGTIYFNCWIGHTLASLDEEDNLIYMPSVKLNEYKVLL